MLKGARDGVLRKVQPISVRGEIAWDVHFTDAGDPDGQIQTARAGPAAVSHALEPGDQIRLEYLLGAVVRVTKLT